MEFRGKFIPESRCSAGRVLENLRQVMTGDGREQDRRIGRAGWLDDEEFLKVQWLGVL